ncbi:MAG: hypothetical protein SW833_06630 [Cyanobacteriota bacterium]|nr:hypothetical protein [Cyanobacteriota bacterium]
MRIPSQALLYSILTIFLSFTVPVLSIVGLLASLVMFGYLPGGGAIATSGTNSILQFLATFGNGCPLSGLFAIGLTCSFVGGLFQLCTYYRYQHL